MDLTPGGTRLVHITHLHPIFLRRRVPRVREASAWDTCSCQYSQASVRCLILSSLPVSRTGTPSALSSLVPSGHCRSTRFGMITAIVWLTRKLCRDTPLICGHSAGGPSAARLHFLTSYLQSSFSCLPTYSAIVLYGSISSRLIQT